MTWDDIKLVGDALGYLSTFLVIITVVATIILCVRGFVPVLVRLGNGLWRRRIAIFAKGDALTELDNLLRDFRLFNTNNILRVASSGDVGRAESAKILLVHWADWADDIQTILDLKKDSMALIVYAPQERGLIPRDAMHLLERYRNVVVNNFRGRLLNDIVVSLITTGYEKG